MKILQIVPSISLIYGGPSQMVLGLAPALVQEGVEVTILTTDSNGDTGQIPLDVPLNRPIKQDGYEIIYFRCAPFRRYKFSLDLLKWLKRHAWEFDVAHIHALFSPISSAAAVVCRQQKLPYILRPLGTLDPADLRKKKQLKQIYTAIIERQNLVSAAAIHFTSEQEAKISERFGVSTPGLVIPLGVKKQGEILKEGRDIVRQQYNIPGDIPLVLFMSRIDPKKGLNLLIPALEKLLGIGYKFHFVLAGTNPQDPDYEEKIKSEIQNSPLRSHATITGFVTGELKANLLQAADLFVLPSYYENFGIAVAEAMLAGIPVIISDQVHIWQQIRDSESGWIGTTEVEVLIDLLKVALDNPAERQRRGLNAHKYADVNFSWDAIAKQTIQAYQKILAKQLI
ncbi:MAG: hormogonium polysaccharide biosynthesis glycosyltransferase HpsP [Nostoc sp. ChiSLP02]|nr:hormogonium polysaccharide biosynthesis glycosyltransferase HpsP [Nostoc sp. DedSLP05]MDZ8099821.1 hormogonium polysaccharide biosynthesis glycosyltransferase HpsP [Nostoc sp. DedSLP01]MDZ8186851.1 hormogonium polysaccharide biosynthesis glycosyltransferase HpsP [Nostoc sp. ChiSLP02]